MQRSGAAERHQREVARVVAALDRHHADRAHHVVVDDGENAARCRHRLDTERLGDPGDDGATRRLDIELEAAAEQLGRQMAEHEMRIGDGRLDAAAAVAAGAGIGAGALRTDDQRAGPATRAIEPPPAPMVTMSTIGSDSGQSPTRPLW